MSILVGNIRLPLGAADAEALEAAAKKCGLSMRELCGAHIYRASIDARRGKITRVLSVLLDLAQPQQEEAVVARVGKNDVRLKKPAQQPVPTGTARMEHRPIVVGLGPGGLFAAYVLAKNGYCPRVFERGQSMESRDRAVTAFFSGGAFDPASNIQFGEGGAGAYSDGKLTTRINDPMSEWVLRTFVEHGAPEEILYKAKPHIGTDILKRVVCSMREEIIRLGGEVHFGCTLTGVRSCNGVLTAAVIDGQEIACDRLILAIGHSARDTFEHLLHSGVYLEPKPFSVGARIEHLQEDLNASLYGKLAGHPALPPAEYTLSHRENGRACYSFCMCPGGQVVNASSEEGMLVVNGMSEYKRDKTNANSALVVPVRPEDFDKSSPLGGMYFQRKYEKLAYSIGGGAAPVQLAKDFMLDRKSDSFEDVQPSFTGDTCFARLDECLPEFIVYGLKDGLVDFDCKIKGFASCGGIMTGVEMRTSAPVRILRAENMQSINTEGLYPAGEGAGYAGGIVSAAVDGIKCAMAVLNNGLNS